MLDQIQLGYYNSPILFFAFVCIDTSEWLIEREIILNHPIPSDFSYEEWLNNKAEDGKLLMQLLAAKVPIVCNQVASLWHRHTLMLENGSLFGLMNLIIKDYQIEENGTMKKNLHEIKRCSITPEGR